MIFGLFTASCVLMAFGSLSQNCDEISCSVEITTEPNVYTEISEEAPEPTPLTPQTTTSSPFKAPASAPTNMPDAKICWCDLTVGSCDMNCCCDLDCSSSQKLVFTDCKEYHNQDPHHCYSSNFLHKKPPSIAVHQQNNLFCIEKDNAFDKKHYQSKSPLKSISEFNRAVSSQRRNFARRRTFLNPFKPAPYKHLSTVWAVSLSKIVPFVIPTSILGSLCLTSQPVLYLRDTTSTCILILPPKKPMCSNAVSASLHKLTDIKLIKSPTTVNISNINSFIKNCTNLETCVTAKLYSCNGSNCQNIEKIDEFSRTFDCEASGLKRIVSIVHNGTAGIQEVQVKLYSIPKKRNLETIIIFKWGGEDNDKLPQRANPGYARGQEILSGVKISNDSTSTIKEIISTDSTRPLTTFIANRGQCNEKRQHLFFGINSINSCYMRKQILHFNHSGCSQLQERIFEVLLEGSWTTQKNKMIAMYANSRLEVINEWLPQLLDSHPALLTPTFKNNSYFYTCKNIVSSLYIDIAIAKFGSFIHPQEKIIGVLYKLGQQKDFSVFCSKSLCNIQQNMEHIKLATHVTFTDLTRPAVIEFARPPGLEAKLPNDFFYPFFAGKASFLQHSATFVFIGLVLLQICT